jgi:PhnB protein
MPVKPIPEGYHSVTPYLMVHDGARALDFYRRAFGAVEVVRMDGPGGKVMHAEIRIGDSFIMLGDEQPGAISKSPQALGGTTSGLVVYVEDADELFGKAVAAGATVNRPMADQFYGDRSGTVTDPFGHVWTVATHKEDVTPDEMRRRMEALMKPA